MEIELEEIQELSRNCIRNLLEERRKTANRMNCYFGKKSPYWQGFYEANEECVKIDSAILLKLKNGVNISEQLKWAIDTERYEYAAELRDRIKKLEHYFARKRATATPRQTL